MSEKVECDMHGTVEATETEGGYYCSVCAMEHGVDRSHNSFVPKHFMETSHEHDEEVNTNYPVEVLIEFDNKSEAANFCHSLSRILEKEQFIDESTVLLKPDDGSASPYLQWDQE